MNKKNNKTANMAELEALLELLTNVMEKKNLSSIKVKRNDESITLQKGGGMMTPMPMTTSSASAMPAQAPDASANAVAPAGDMAGAIKSPVVGTVYLAPKPGEPNFVKVGDHVKKGAILMIVEAMKVMNQITATKDGTVSSILVNNEDPVEFGQPLLTIT